jgi:hypothetical protein
MCIPFLKLLVSTVSATTPEGTRGALRLGADRQTQLRGARIEAPVESTKALQTGSHNPSLALFESLEQVGLDQNLVIRRG